MKALREDKGRTTFASSTAWQDRYARSILDIVYNTQVQRITFGEELVTDGFGVLDCALLLKLHRETQAGQVAAVLRDAILRGDLQPGEALRQEELADRIGVSRVPLREALRQLEGEGFVRSDSYRGTHVLDSTAQDALDAARVRILLELDALTPAVKVHTAETLQACDDAICAALNDPRVDEHWFEHNWAFHRLLYAPLNRPYFSETIRNCLRKTQLYSWPKHLWHSREKSCEEHKAILDAVSQQDATHAKRLLKAHLEVDLHSLQTECDNHLR